MRAIASLTCRDLDFGQDTKVVKTNVNRRAERVRTIHWIFQASPEQELFNNDKSAAGIWLRRTMWNYG